VTRQARAAHTYGASITLQQQRPALQRPYLRLPCKAVRAVWHHFVVISPYAWEQACCTDSIIHGVFRAKMTAQSTTKRTVLPPTTTASERARASNTSCREAGEETQAEWPAAVAILPSAVIAYFSTENGRPVAARCSSACRSARSAVGARAVERAQKLGCCSGARSRPPQKQPCQRRPAEHGPPAEGRAREAGL
jgi:hypothetical protein